MSPTDVRDALLAALAIQVVLVAVSSVLTGDNGTVGAPIAVAAGSGFSGGNPFGGVRGLVALGIFAVDVIVTSLPILALVRWAGSAAAMYAAIGGVVALVVAAVTYVLMASGHVPFAGIPLPVASQPGDHVALLTLWLDCLLLAALFAGVYGLTQRA